MLANGQNLFVFKYRKVLKYEICSDAVRSQKN